MSAPLPPLHALTIVHPTSRLRPAQRVRLARPVAPLARLWSWLMEPIAHDDQPSTRAQLLKRMRMRTQESTHQPVCVHP
jgi:hypothetical protein